jgi:predicted secreted protein
VLEQLGEPGFRPSSSGFGAGGEVILRYRAAAPGQFMLSLTYGRPFEALPPNPETFDLFVFVQ